MHQDIIPMLTIICISAGLFLFTYWCACKEERRQHAIKDTSS